MVEEVPTLSARVSAVLFVSPRPLELERIAEVCEAGISEVERVLDELSEHFQAGVTGFRLEMVDGRYCFRTVPAVSSYIKRLIPARAKRLSRAAAETLAVIAYKQPVQRSEIESIRGVDALPTLRTLLDAKLIRIVGREDTVGQPALYGTTGVFLEKFGLRDLSELPTIGELQELESESTVADEGSAATEYLEDEGSTEQVLEVDSLFEEEARD